MIGQIRTLKEKSIAKPFLSLQPLRHEYGVLWDRNAQVKKKSLFFSHILRIQKSQLKLVPALLLIGVSGLGIRHCLSIMNLENKICIYRKNLIKSVLMNIFWLGQV
jgi:hypothetical protein